MHTAEAAPSGPNPISQNPLKSFKDTLVDGESSVSPPLVTYEELVAANLPFDSSTPMVEDGSDPTQAKIPKVRIPKSIWQRLCSPWKNAVIIKLLGKSVHYNILHSRLLKEWRTENDFEVIDVGLGYYIVKFSSPQDCSTVLTGGPYKLFGHYLAVQPWEPGFHPARAKAPKTAVWVKLHGVPIVCFQEAICLYLGSKIGKPIKVDPTTLLATRGKFARVCIEVDLSQQLPSTVDLDLEELPQSLVLVEYEGLHKICFHCGEFDHTEDFCHYKNPGKVLPVSNPKTKAMIELSESLKPNTEENNMVFGPWMVQQGKTRRKTQPHRSAEAPASNSHVILPKISGSQTLAPKNLADPQALNAAPKPSPHVSRGNRFAVMTDLMEEEIDLQNPNAINDPITSGMVGISPQTQNVVIDSEPEMVSQPNSEPQPHPLVGPHVSDNTNLPPAPSTAFVKPKPKRKKNKSGGPVQKDTKLPASKPYQPPILVKKQQEHSPQIPTSTLEPQFGDSTSPTMVSPGLEGGMRQSSLLLVDTTTNQHQCNEPLVRSDTGQHQGKESPLNNLPLMVGQQTPLAAASSAATIPPAL
ncbi:hypothetical protein SLA2020_329290 [Shorea laevis]